jgi:HpcH/HpaI aldolase/citrate lyase family
MGPEIHSSGSTTFELAKALECHAVIRAGSHHASEILRALDIGAEGIIVLHVNRQEEAEAIVRSAHYPPIGRRGLATTTRAGKHTFSNLKEHLRAAQENTLIAVQVEDPEGIEHVGAIASVPFIDCVFIGPTDLSLGLGHAGENDHPVVTEAFARICSAIQASQHSTRSVCDRCGRCKSMGHKRCRFRGLRLDTTNRPKIPRSKLSTADSNGVVANSYALSWLYSRRLYRRHRSPRQPGQTRFSDSSSSRPTRTSNRNGGLADVIVVSLRCTSA